MTSNNHIDMLGEWEAKDLVNYLIDDLVEIEKAMSKISHSKDSRSDEDWWQYILNRTISKVTGIPLYEVSDKITDWYWGEWRMNIYWKWHKKEFVLIDSEKWGVIDSLCRELRDYKRDFMKAMGTIG